MSIDANINKTDTSSNDFVMKSTDISLHPIEKNILSILHHSGGLWTGDNQLIEKSKLSIDQLRRGVEWLKFKNLIAIKESSDIEISLKKSNIINNDFVLPERKLINCVKKGKKILTDIIKSDEFNNNNKEVYASLKFCKQNSWIDIKNNSVVLLPNSENLSDEEKLIKKLLKSNSLKLSNLNKSEIASFDLLKKRHDVLDIKKIRNKEYAISDWGVSVFDKMIYGVGSERKLTVEHLISGEWRNLEFDQIDVEAPLPLLNYGKKNPLVDFIDEVKEILIGMGFSEIEGDLAQTSFWNFDALFIPQDHSARDMQDTFYLKPSQSIVSPLPDENIVKNVSKIHEQNWHYEWDVSESKSYVLRTHTTPVTIQYLAKEKPESDKVFLIGRVFRNEKASFKHLVEFHQVEGIFTSKDANLRQLMAIQTEFYNKLGIKKIKFWPTFFPYTEPSLQSMVYNDKFDKWIELFGMGMFRPEVTLPLGVKNPVLAWGGGFERLAMLRFNLNDIRELYSNNLTWLKGVPKCLL